MSLFKLYSIYLIEFLGNSLIQTNQTKRTKQIFFRLSCFDCWIQIIQFDEQNKNSTKCIAIQVVRFDELLFCLFCLICLVCLS